MMDKKIVKQEQQDKDQHFIGLVKTLFPQLGGVSDLEVAKAMTLLKKMGFTPLDLFQKRIHLVPFRGSIQVVVSYTEYIRRAIESGKLKWWTVEVGKDEIGGVYAEVKIARTDWDREFTWRVYLEEAKKDTQPWKSSPIFMLKKVTISQGFRLAFPELTMPLGEEEIDVLLDEDMVESYEDEKISEEQARRLWAIAKTLGKEVGIDKVEVEKVVRDVLRRYNLESTREIPAALYDEVIENIKARILELAKAEEARES